MKLPSCLESEKALLSCLILAARKELSDIADELLQLPDEIFTTMFNRQLFKAIKSLANTDTPITELALEDILKTKELQVMDDNLLETLVDIMGHMPSAYDAPVHLSRLMRINERRNKLYALVDHNKNYVRTRNNIIADLNDMSKSHNEEELQKFFNTMSRFAQEGSDVNEKQ